MLGDILTAQPGKTGRRYEGILSLCGEESVPHAQFRVIWNAYLDMTGGNDKRFNGAIFELAVAEMMARFGVTPFYWQAKLWGVDYSIYDIALWTGAAPVVLSLKTSLRERWKQADLEGRLLKMRYPNAECWLVTNNNEEATRLSAKSNLDGLDGIVVAGEREFDGLIAHILDAEPRIAEAIVPLSGVVVETR